MLSEFPLIIGNPKGTNIGATADQPAENYDAPFARCGTDGGAELT
jgi:hypothetical protein